ncbi:MAG: hypothetical protein KDE31_18335, partial [Caldilineaceae bacterium]|nr:hypothetical protein [Caldilineaceae bacterium]
LVAGGVGPGKENNYPRSCTKTHKEKAYPSCNFVSIRGSFKFFGGRKGFRLINRDEHVLVKRMCSSLHLKSSLCS